MRMPMQHKKIQTNQPNSCIFTNKATFALNRWVHILLSCWYIVISRYTLQIANYRFWITTRSSCINFDISIQSSHFYFFFLAIMQFLKIQKKNSFSFWFIRLYSYVIHLVAEDVKMWIVFFNFPFSIIPHRRQAVFDISIQNSFPSKRVRVIDDEIQNIEISRPQTHF